MVEFIATECNEFASLKLDAVFTHGFGKTYALLWLVLVGIKRGLFLQVKMVLTGLVGLVQIYKELSERKYNAKVYGNVLKKKKSDKYCTTTAVEP